MKKYTKDQFKADRDRLIAIVGNKLSYCGCDPGTYRVTFGDDVLQIYFDVYLSRRTVAVWQLHHGSPRYYRNQTWEQLVHMFSHIADYLF